MAHLLDEVPGLVAVSYTHLDVYKRQALSMCVFPFILPDIAKMALAILISARLKPLLKRR